MQRAPFKFPQPLYPIIDTLGDASRSHVALAEMVLAAGVKLLQLRVKNEPTRTFVELARAVHALAHQYGAALIINDRADVARLVGADGVHVGQDDLPAAAVRDIIGPDKIVGFSTHNLAQARQAAADGLVDYIGYGPIFATASKQRPDPLVGLDGLRRVRSCVDLPIVAIGGITAATVRDALAAGADAVAMIGAIVAASDPRVATVQLLQLCASA